MSDRHPYLSHFAGGIRSVESYASAAAQAVRMAQENKITKPGQMSWSQYTCWKYVDTNIVLYPGLPYFTQHGTPHQMYAAPPLELGESCSLALDDLIAKAHNEGIPVAERLKLIEKWKLPSRHGGWKRDKGREMLADQKRLLALKTESALPWKIDPPKEPAHLARARISRAATLMGGLGSTNGWAGSRQGGIRDRTAENLVATHGTKTGPWNAVVIHHAVGSARESEGVMPPGESGSVENITYHLAKRDVGYHFLITRDGVVHQLVPLDKKVWHAGQNRGPSYLMDKPTYLAIQREVVAASEGGAAGTITEAKRKIIGKRYEETKAGGYIDPDALQPWQQGEPYAKLPDGSSPNSNSIGISLAFRTGTALYNIRPGEFREHPDPYFVNPKYGPRGRWAEIASPEQEEALVNLIAKLQNDGTVGTAIYSHGPSEPGRPELGVVAQKTDPGWGLNLTRVIDRVRALRGTPAPVADVRSAPDEVVMQAGMPVIAFLVGGGLAWLAWKQAEESVR